MQILAFPRFVINGHKIFTSHYCHWSVETIVQMVCSSLWKYNNKFQYSVLVSLIPANGCWMAVNRVLFRHVKTHCSRAGVPHTLETLTRFVHTIVRTQWTGCILKINFFAWYYITLPFQRLQKDRCNSCLSDVPAAYCCDRARRNSWAVQWN